MIRISLEGKLLALVGSGTLTGLLSGLALAALTDSYLAGLSLGALLSLTLAVVLVRYSYRRTHRILDALTDNIASFRDGDFSVSLGTSRRDELGRLVAAFNNVGDVLRSERQNLFQRELMLDTVIQSTPTALILTDAADHIVYCNMAARRLFLRGRRLEGYRLQTLISEQRPEFLPAVREGREGIYSIQADGEEHYFHLSHGQFRLNARPHRLYLFNQLTRELNRQEVATWKKVIRVISHELNNSLAPISSLAYSGRELIRRGEPERTEQILATIGERANALKQFIEGYVRFAKLPAPTPEAVDWNDFLNTLKALSEFTLASQVPDRKGWFDPVQIQQVMLNLLKNAVEAGSDRGAIEVEIAELPGQARITVRDRGSGMSEKVLRHALLPFYSTKRSGSGLGLSLCREIIEAHGGRLSIENRLGGGLQVSFALPSRPTLQDD